MLKVGQGGKSSEMSAAAPSQNFWPEIVSVCAMPDWYRAWPAVRSTVVPDAHAVGAQVDLDLRDRSARPTTRACRPRADLLPTFSFSYHYSRISQMV